MATVIQHFIMKTFNGKNISKKNIISIIRTMNSTKIYALYAQIYGGKVIDSDVCRFIKMFAPTQALERAAYDLTIGQAHIRRIKESYVFRNEREYRKANIKHEVIEYFKEQIRDVNSPYAKKPMMGHTHLYFCSPIYGHRDYNKWQAMEIRGNEKFCETIIKLADKYFPIVK